MRRWLKPLWILLALVFLFEAWLWKHLTAFAHAVIDYLPWRAFKERFAKFVDGLSPYATLPVFILPFILLLPLKFIQVYLIVHHRWFSAIAVLVLAKLLGLGITAFIFEVTKPKLMQLGWFRWLYELMLVWLAKAHALIDPIKNQVKAWLAENRRRVLAWLLPADSGRSNWFLRRLAALRRRMQPRQPAE
jgi:hypothetical protein